jgi:Predicted ATPase involved in replication control, Cdc46/Mcm family
MAVDPNIVFLIGTLVPTVVGAVGLFNALRTYRDGQLLKRKDLIIPLIDQFDNSEDLFLAKAILDDFSCNIPPSGTNNEILEKLIHCSEDDLKFYNKSNLKNFYDITGIQE